MDLPAAQQLIDIIGMIKEKTRGNLDHEEAGADGRDSLRTADEIRREGAPAGPVGRLAGGSLWADHDDVARISLDPRVLRRLLIAAMAAFASAQPPSEHFGPDLATGVAARRRTCLILRTSRPGSHPRWSTSRPSEDQTNRSRRVRTIPGRVRRCGEPSERYERRPSEQSGIGLHDQPERIYPDQRSRGRRRGSGSTVTLQDGHEYRARVVGRDDEDRHGLIKIDAPYRCRWRHWEIRTACGWANG